MKITTASFLEKLCLFSLLSKKIEDFACIFSVLFKGLQGIFAQAQAFIM